MGCPSLAGCVCVCVYLSECLFFFVRRLVRSNNASAFVVTVPDENQCKLASLIAACCLGCCLFVTSIVCVCVCVCVWARVCGGCLRGGQMPRALDRPIDSACEHNLCACSLQKGA